MSSGRRRLLVPDAADDRATNRGIARDPDTWEPTDEEWARAKPLSKIDPDLPQALSCGDITLVIRRGDAADAPEVRRVRVAPFGGEWIVEAEGDLVARETFADAAAARDRARALAALPTKDAGRLPRRQGER